MRKYVFKLNQINQFLHNQCIHLNYLSLFLIFLDCLLFFAAGAEFVVFEPS